MDEDDPNFSPRSSGDKKKKKKKRSGSAAAAAASEGSPRTSSRRSSGDAHPSERVDASAAIMSLESDVQAKNRARSSRSSAASRPGAQSASGGSQATSKASGRSLVESGEARTVAEQRAGLRSLEDDLHAKNQTQIAGASPGGQSDPAARKASRQTTTSAVEDKLNSCHPTPAASAANNYQQHQQQHHQRDQYSDDNLKESFLDEDLNKHTQEEMLGNNGFGEANVYHQPAPPESAQENGALLPTGGSNPNSNNNGLSVTPMDGGEDAGIEAFVADNQVIEAAGVAVIMSDEEQERLEKKRLRRYMMMGIACLLLIMAAIIIPVVIVFGNSNASSADNGLAPALSPTNMPSAAPTTSRLKDIMAYAATVSDPATLQDENSPQFRAATWVSDEDLAMAEFGSVKLLQRYVLAVFYFSTGGDNWEECSRKVTCNVGFSWLAGQQDECLWHGVRCTAANPTKQIQKLLIGNQAPLGNNLVGTLPKEMAKLTEMTSIVLIEGKIGGTIPTEFGMWAKLDTMFIQAHELTGTIPVEIIQNAKALDMFALGNNLLEGPIPTALSALPLLRDLQLWGNQFTGTIPPQLGTQTGTMRNLELQLNKLVGTVPETLYNLVLLSQLSLDNNLLTGTISASVGKLVNARILEYNGNRFTGNIPMAMYTLPELETLRLGNNQMSGPLSEQLSQLNTTLEEFSIPNNDFSGPFLQAFDVMTHLNDLILHGTDLTGAVTLTVCDRKGGSDIKNLTVPATVDCNVKPNCCDLTLS